MLWVFELISYSLVRLASHWAQNNPLSLVCDNLQFKEMH